MVPCTRDEYKAAVAANGGIEALCVLSGYTRVDGDEWGNGTQVDTVWGLRDGTPVVESSRRNDGGSRSAEPDRWLFWVWVPDVTQRTEVPT